VGCQNVHIVRRDNDLTHSICTSIGLESKTAKLTTIIYLWEIRNLKNQSTWREFIQNLTPNSTFHSPAILDEINKVELTLDVLLPDELKSLLQESNGVEGSYGLGLIWDVERIQKDNLFFREFADYKDIYMPFDDLLFFADAGNGDQFAFTVLNGEIRKGDIFVWNHEDDSRQWAAPSLDVYLEWWLTGKLII
jgi:hypothetical protein